MIYLISYNINKAVGDYDPLYNAIKSLGHTYWHLQESLWFVTEEYLDIQKAIPYLRRFIYSGDTIFMAELRIDNNVDGWVTRDFWEWYKNNM